MSRLRRAPIHISGSLLQTLAYRPLQAAVQHLALDHEPILCVRRRAAIPWPDDEQVGTAPAEAILPLDAAAAVHDALQEGLQQELGAGFRIVEARDPMFGVLAEELLKAGE